MNHEDGWNLLKRFKSSCKFEHRYKHEQTASKILGSSIRNSLLHLSMIRKNINIIHLDISIPDELVDIGEPMQT